MRFGFIQAQKANHSVALMCEVLGVSRSGFYAWCNRTPSVRAQKDAELSAHVIAVHNESHQRYGSPRIHRALRARDIRLSRKRVARLMAENGLRARFKRRFVRTTDSRHALPVAKNILNREFTPAAPNRVWASDITYIPTGERWLYLAVVIDLYSRMVVGWAVSEHTDTSLVATAFKRAVRNRRPGPGAIHHSDKGTQYASHEYRALLERSGFVASMSRTGNCWDNACVESFFSSLKNEMVHRYDFATREHARRALFDYIEVFYNRKRLHSSLGYRSPVAYEALTQTRVAA